MSTLQLDQIHLLLDTWLRNMDDVAANEEGILVTLQGSLPDSRSPLNTAKLFDKTEDMLTAIFVTQYLHSDQVDEKYTSC